MSISSGGLIRRSQAGLDAVARGRFRRGAVTLSYELHGLKLSYFTGKLEAYMRAKGLPFRFVEMDMADFRRCAWRPQRM